MIHSTMFLSGGYPYRKTDGQTDEHTFGRRCVSCGVLFRMQKYS